MKNVLGRTTDVEGCTVDCGIDPFCTHPQEFCAVEARALRDLTRYRRKLVEVQAGQ